MQKESLGERFTEVPFLSQFSFPNDVPYDRNISVAISMDYGTSIRARVKADVERWEIINSPGTTLYFIASDFFRFQKFMSWILHIFEYYVFLWIIIETIVRATIWTIIWAIICARTITWIITRTIIQTTFSSHCSMTIYLKLNLKFNLISCKCKYANYHAVRYSWRWLRYYTDFISNIERSRSSLRWHSASRRA